MIADQLQVAVFQALTGAQVCEGRVYDRVPADAAFPYVTIGDEQIVPDGNSCNDAWTVYCDVHVWSRPIAGSKVEAKRIVATIYDALQAILTVEGHIVVVAELDRARTLRDPDGMTEHTVMTFRYDITPDA